MNNIFLQPPYQQPPIYPQEKDWIYELDILLKDLSEQEVNALNDNEKWNELNTSLSTAIHEELMDIIRARLVMRGDVISNVKQQIELINETKRKCKDIERRNLNDINDYMKNYSHLTFDEYKKIKTGGDEN